MQTSLGIAIKKANNALARDSDHFAKQLGLTGTQISTINFIADHEATQDIFQRDLEHEFNIRKATASSLVTTMVAKDLLLRVPATNDARYKRLLLTPHARQLAQTIEAFFANSERRMRQLLGPDFDTIHTQLTQISQTFTAENTSAPQKKA
ncbi:MarR family winged helix-turn-helix transcriptional regulator [Lactiplantibacillus mudanjiangensis]|uniref:MarR family transcriptional regulator [Lactobacillus sp.] n=1 Tax=Lactiplantibacillus mudanjiangensis TaxID=1296538 RepID=A0A660DVF3_9LACO|nr:MarR family winged helix-turn-helix transcriptional regulator [Lactiplantibacillus mudanjiangensis]VDG19995.1 MarR family transcriptional regulator [Lactobacillus sp.] [Lactiplantibacillus mudanjiangensis]VDG26157.1 MarR family transcriptional regulator [Lactobacillus sp.] [Lactiplantibacillus mudanjiangensis]VDG27307.1 MarR family transcriptional regulator [Lactobacillus sp.] [Lactiplantibacillus mudanjiangensis]VDG33390.1 MarR family transcriptional regulator [Lactobacillus sp.] [Lactiplan